MASAATIVAIGLVTRQRGHGIPRVAFFLLLKSDGEKAVGGGGEPTGLVGSPHCVEAVLPGTMQGEVQPRMTCVAAH
jgi:hypothetical protein